MTFQDLILKLQHFWASQGCLLQQPLDLEVGAGTSHPETLLRVLEHAEKFYGRKVDALISAEIGGANSMFPVALGLAGDPSVRAPIGVAVLGGLIVSTVVSLFIVPVFYTLLDDMQLAVAHRFGKWFRSETDKKLALTPGAPPLA